MPKGRSRVVESSENVDAYVEGCPSEARTTLTEIRAAIRGIAPGVHESTSYFDIPGFFYPGYDYNGMFAWISYKDGFIGLHLRPPVIEVHAKELLGYATTKAIVRFPAGQKVPIALVKKLVRASLKVMKDKAAS